MRDGDVLRGTFEGMPADTPAVTTTPPIDDIADLDLVFLKDHLTTEWRYGRGWISYDQVFLEAVGAAICTALGAVVSRGTDTST